LIANTLSLCIGAARRYRLTREPTSCGQKGASQQCRKPMQWSGHRERIAACDVGSLARLHCARRKARGPAKGRRFYEYVKLPPKQGRVAYEYAYERTRMNGSQPAALAA
jgi:hypothetical protein